MEYLKKLSLWVKVAGGIISLCAALYAGFVYAGDLIVWRGHADSTYATKHELEITNKKLGSLSRTLPIKVELRLKRGQIDQLSTTIMYGEEHGLDTELDKLKKQRLNEKILMLEMDLRRIESGTN